MCSSFEISEAAKLSSVVEYYEFSETKVYFSKMPWISQGKINNK